MPLGIDPTVDYVFKKLFGDPENSDLLIHLLNAVMTPRDPIVEVELLNPFNDKEFAEDKLSVVDVRARDGHGNWYNVEVQTRARALLRQRLPYYNSLLYTGQLAEGEDFDLIEPAITICFLGEVLFREAEAPHLVFSLCDCRHKVQLTERFQVHTIELPKYNFDRDSISAADPLKQWSFFLSRAAQFEAVDLNRMLPDRAYRKATGVIEMISRTPQQRAWYESRRKAELDYKSFLAAAVREGRAEGRVEGREEGREEGRAEGRTEGVNEGIEQGLKLGLAKQVLLLQKILRKPLSDEAELLAMQPADLQQMCDELQSQFPS